MSTQTSDDQTAEALAEAMFPSVGKVPDDPIAELRIARLALQALSANPEILRSMGIGRLPTQTQLRELHGEHDYLIEEDAIDAMIAEGWAIPNLAPAGFPVMTVTECWGTFLSTDKDAFKDFDGYLHAIAPVLIIPDPAPAVEPELPSLEQRLDAITRRIDTAIETDRILNNSAHARIAAVEQRVSELEAAAESGMKTT